MLGLLLVDHGSRRAEANAQLEAMGALLRDLRPDDVVAIAHLEQAEPSIEEAVGRLAARGVSEIRVLTYFLSDGRHAQIDIPRLCQEAAAGHPGLRISIAPPLGVHRALAHLLLERAGLEASTANSGSLSPPPVTRSPGGG